VRARERGCAWPQADGDSGLLFAGGSHRDFALPFWRDAAGADLAARGYRLTSAGAHPRLCPRWRPADRARGRSVCAPARRASTRSRKMGCRVCASSPATLVPLGAVSLLLGALAGSARTKRWLGASCTPAVRGRPL